MIGASIPHRGYFGFENVVEVFAAKRARYRVNIDKHQRHFLEPRPLIRKPIEM